MRGGWYTRASRGAWVLLIGVMALCTSAQSAQVLPVTIEHREFMRPQRRGAPLVIEATITAPAGIRQARVFCRPAGGRDYTAIPMERVADDHYRAIVPDWLTAAEALEYYITATDLLGHSVSQGFAGFPLVVQLVAKQALSREERLRMLQQTLEFLRKRRGPSRSEEQLYQDPLLGLGR